MVPSQGERAWVQGGRMTDEQKEKVAKRLARLEAKHGRLTPLMVVDDARDPKSPLHAEFEWDDSLAGEKWRQQQARVLIHSVRVETTIDETVVRQIAYVRDPNCESDEQGYVSVQRLKMDPKSAREALLYEIGRAESMFERAKEVAFVLGLESEVDSILTGIERLHDLVQAT